MSRPKDPASFAQRVQRMEPGQTIHFPLIDYSRASLHVSLSRIRREYKDLMGCSEDELPRWTISTPTPPGDVWAITYVGLGQALPAVKPRRETPATSQELRAKRREQQQRYRAKIRSAAAARLWERSQKDPSLKADAHTGFEEDLAESLRQQIADDAAAKAARKAEMQARRDDPNYKPRGWKKSKADIENEERAAKRREQRAAVRAYKQELLERRLQERMRPPSPGEIRAQLNKLEVSLAFYQERQEQLEARLEEAQAAQAKAKRIDQLTPEQQARVRQGLVECRWDRAQKRIDEYLERLAKYDDKIKALEAEIGRLKSI